MTEADALHERRQFLLEQLSRAADEIMWIDERLSFIFRGKPGAGNV